MIIPSQGFIDDLKKACVLAGLTARDFCGNERQAILDAAKERGVTLSEASIYLTMEEIDREWDNARKALAGEEP